MDAIVSSSTRGSVQVGLNSSNIHGNDLRSIWGWSCLAERLVSPNIIRPINSPPALAVFANCVAHRLSSHPNIAI